MKSQFWVDCVGRMAAVVPLAFLGCVPYQTYEALKSEKLRLQSAHDDLVTKYNLALQGILRREKEGASSQVLLEKVANLEALNDDLKTKLGQLAATGGGFEPKDLERLPPGVTLEGKSLSLGEEVLFNSGEAKLKNAQARYVLDSIVDLIQKEHRGEIIHLIGHTDNDPVARTKGLWDNNHNLAYNRAYTVFKYFVDKGIPDNRLMLHSLAYLRPVDLSDTKEAKARNRRVNIALGGAKF